MTFKKMVGAIAVLMLTILTVGSIAFPLWLSKPVRDNANDPKSHLWVPTPIPFPTPPAMRDGWDPADDAFATATALTLGTSQNGHYIGAGGATPDTVDYFSFPSTSGGNFNITATITSGTGTLSIDFTNQTCCTSNPPVASGSSGTVVKNAVGTVSGLPEYFRITATGNIGYNIVVTMATPPSATPSITQTNTPMDTPTPTDTPNVLFSPTHTPTNTPVIPPTFTSTATPSNTPVATFTDTPSVPTCSPCGTCILYEDFETAGPVGVYNYSDGTNSLTIGPGSAQVYCGTASAEWVFDTSNTTPPNWGAGGGHGSNYALPSAGSPFDATGAQRIRFWMWSDVAVDFALSIKEMTVAVVWPATDPANENWSSPTQSHPGGSAWVNFDLDLSTFTENNNNPDCTPNCLDPGVGNNTFDKDNINGFDVQALVGFGPGTFYIDDIWYDTAGPPTPTFTPTPTNTPYQSPTYTFTPVAGFAGIWYDGETAGALLSDVTLAGVVGAGGDMAGMEERNDGASSLPNYLRLTGTTVAASYFMAGRIDRAAEDLSTSFNHLEIDFRVSGASCPRPGIQVVSANAVTWDAQSVIVDLGKYMTAQAPVGDSVWYTASIPYAAFTGANDAGGNFAIGEFAQITTVQIRPMGRSFDGGAMTSVATLDVDNIVFSGTAAPAVLPKPRVLADFESPVSGVGGSETNWSTFMFVYSDQEPAPAFPSCTGFGGLDTAWTYPGIGGNPVDTGGASVTSCLAGHISGTKGGGGATCNNNYSYIGMGMGFNTVEEVACGATKQVAVDMQAMLGLGGPVQGIRFKAKAGPGHAAAQQYLLMLDIDTCPAGGGQEFLNILTTADLTPLNTWISFDIPIPLPGTMGKTVDNNVTFGQINQGWVTEFAFTNNWRSLSLTPDIANTNFDIWIDDIEFY